MEMRYLAAEQYPDYETKKYKAQRDRKPVEDDI
jgi:hypothetical protein